MDQRVAVFVPSVFSPNDDGVNDILTVFADQQVKLVKSFRIFNRWGGMVFLKKDFLPNDIRNGWDGNYLGQALNPDVFVFTLEVELFSGVITQIQGDVTLVR